MIGGVDNYVIRFFNSVSFLIKVIIMKLKGFGLYLYWDKYELDGYVFLIVIIKMKNICGECVVGGI